MSDYTPPTAQSASDRAKFDQLRRHLDGRPQVFRGHHVQAIPAKVVPLPKTN